MKIQQWQKDKNKQTKKNFVEYTFLHNMEMKYIRRSWKVLMPWYLKGLNNLAQRPIFRKLHLVAYYMGFRYELEGEFDFRWLKTREVQLYVFHRKIRSWKGIYTR